MSTTQKRCCPALAHFRFDPDTSKYELYKFEKRHNHKLFTVSDVYLSKNKRKLDYTDEKFIYDLSKCNIGATKAHSIMSTLKGGHDQVRGTKVDYKNYARDLNLCIGENDATMTVNRMNNRKENVHNFSFEYICSDSEFAGLFWANEIAKANFKEFGDMVYFDATYSTNTYNMIFVPFTGIDNHKRSVTFGAGLLCNETADSYTWLLRCFMKAFNKEPNVVVTDQDPAMRKAVITVFKTARHRLCMWHIGKKLDDKVSPQIMATEFKKRIHALIWNHKIDRDEFDTTWGSLMNEYNLSENIWLKDMFSTRDRWIPAYFKDIPLAGLMRTTSRSESENSFFGSYLNNCLNLLSFTSSFEAAMEKQRNTQYINDYESQANMPVFKTRLLIEKHASEVYTYNIFKIVQKQIDDSVYICSQHSVHKVGELEVCIVKDERKVSFKKIYEGCDDTDEDCTTTVEEIIFESEYKVEINEKEETITCSCNFYLYQGVFCRHIFCILKRKKIDQIPTKYILRRWQKCIISSEQLKQRYHYGRNSGLGNQMIEDAYSIFQSCIEMASDDLEVLNNLLKDIGEIKAKMETNLPRKEPKKRSERIEEHLGVSIPDVTEIQNPKNIRTKGSGSGKRIKGAKEKAIEKSNKDKRECHYCHKFEPHDWRNCPTRKEDEKSNLEKENDILEN